MSKSHYENFPVASLLVPQRYRPAILTLYEFARSADDLADTEWATAPEKLRALEGYRQDLKRLEYRQPPEFDLIRRLGTVIRDHHLPYEPFHALLSAFIQDVTVQSYPDEMAVMDYCSRSANPIGRLLLALWKAPMTAEQLLASDAICSALQRINFIQDVAIDAAIGRVYLPETALKRHGVSREEILALRLKMAPAPSRALRDLLLEECAAVRTLLLQGAPLLPALPFRLRAELKCIMAGGLKILEKIQAVDADVVFYRPTLSRWDLPSLLHRAFVKGFPPGSAKVNA